MKIRIAFIGLLLLAAGAGMNVRASENISNVEAMFIYNFLRHINWPEENTGNEFVIAVYGESPVFDQLQRYAQNRKVGTRPIVIRTINSESEALACQLVFVPISKSSKLSDLKKHVGSRSCLIVGEQEGSNAVGATVEFLVQDSKLKFRINEAQARQQNLSISRTLLDMAI